MTGSGAAGEGEVVTTGQVLGKLKLESSANNNNTARTDLEVVQDVYFKLTTVQWEWANELSPWQAAAVRALVYPANLVHPLHPLQEGSENGFTAYIGTEKDGKRRLLLSLKQMEFLQLYIHEMRLADPVWVEHLSKLHDAAPGEEVEFHEEVGPPAYPEGGEWVPLPNDFYRREAFTSMETISFDEMRVLRKVMDRLRKANKSIERQNLVADPSTATSSWDQAVLDNVTDGPGLRKGGQNRLNVKSDDVSRKRLEEDETLISGGKVDEEGEKTGWGGFPLLPHQGGDDPGNPNAQNPAEAPGKRPSDSANGTASPPQVVKRTQDTTLNSISPRDIIGDRPAPVKDDENSDYYHLAQQALTIAALGGIFAAHKTQQGHPEPDEEEESEDSSALPPIGKSLFISLHIATWEADESVILDVGWSAIWWQEAMHANGSTEGGDVTAGARYEEMRDRGHYIVQDHLLSKKNGMWKSDMRQQYLFGNSLPVSEADLDTMIKTLIKDLSKEAGGGPVYVVTHGAFELDRLDLGTEHWYNLFKPMGWQYPCFSCTDGINNTFVINTAILFAAIENSKTTLNQSRLSLEEVGMMMFGPDGPRSLARCGNAGNDAFYNLEILLSILTGPSLEDLQNDFAKAHQTALQQATADGAIIPDDENDDESPAKLVTSTSVAQTSHSTSWPNEKNEAKDEKDSPPTTPLMSPSPDPASDSDSDDGHIKGVYWDQGDGDLVELET